MWKEIVGSLDWQWKFPNLSVVVFDTTRNHLGIRLNTASCLQTVVKKEGKRPHRDSWRSSQTKDILVLAKYHSFVLRCILTSGRCVGKGQLFMAKAEVSFSFWIWCEWLPLSKEKPGPLRDHISTRRFLLSSGANPASGYKVGKNKDFSCLATMGLKTNAFDSYGSGKRHCLWLIRLVQEWGSPTPWALCRMDINLVGWDTSWGTEAIPLHLACHGR